MERETDSVYMWKTSSAFRASLRTALIRDLPSVIMPQHLMVHLRLLLTSYESSYLSSYLSLSRSLCVRTFSIRVMHRLMVL